MMPELGCESDALSGLGRFVGFVTQASARGARSSLGYHILGLSASRLSRSASPGEIQGVA